jgi:hypothetical protein
MRTIRSVGSDTAGEPHPLAVSISVATAELIREMIEDYVERYGADSLQLEAVEALRRGLRDAGAEVD